ncbi:uncharacterized protein LOC111691657 [Anoplophora glabripennis]|uniref:uncharacterized protein LOC111691657 n=1 Tax=Anoplophora glabripennis TaxID=217634 RepID=UPI000C7579FF|nr:uncharacterized protein LOC111691657 [Anoplophora glabripennis]
MYSPKMTKKFCVLSPYVVVGSETVPETSVIHFDFNHDNDQTQEICDDHTDENEVHEDHLYTKNIDDTENQENVNKYSVPSTSKDKDITGFAKAKSITKEKRTVAATRLLNSANATTILAETSKKDLELKDLYYTKKLILLERQTTALEQLVNILKRDV